MLGRTHLVVGLTTFIAVEAMTGFVQTHPLQGIPTGPALCAGATMLGALMPDIDAEESEIKNTLGTVGTIISTLLETVGVTHRGLTHYGVTVVLVMGISTLLGWWLNFPDVGLAFSLGYLSLAFSLGYLSHVALADAATLAGVPLLWPLSGKFHLVPRPFRIRTGGSVERLIFIGLLVALIFLLPTLIPGEWVKLIHRWL
jgi:membrane-bound metal-dependent hydrolase YbcI (DUF457 family)